MNDLRSKSSPKNLLELLHNKHSSNYIPNFDRYTAEEKLALLKKYFPRDLSNKKLTTQVIDYLFRRRISKQIRDMLEDIKGIGS